MAIVKIGKSHNARKQLFQRGLRRGFLTVQEIEEALPSGTLTAAERWLLYYSLRAAEIEVRDETGALVSVPALTEDELVQLATERDQANHVPADQGTGEVEEELGTLEEHEGASLERGD